MVNTIREIIVRYIVMKIDTNTWKYNEKIISESQLAKKFDCSRSTVREALKQLINSGYLLSQMGSGYFVNKKLDEFSSKRLGSVELVDVPESFFTLFEISKASIKYNGFKKIFYNSKKEIEALQYTILNKDFIWKIDPKDFSRGIAVALAKKGFPIITKSVNGFITKNNIFKDYLQELNWDKKGYFIELVKSKCKEGWLEMTIRIFKKEKLKISYIQYSHE